MKISKLFHWLYGFVMLLPIFAIGSACLISTFNMSTKDESEIHYKYETNDVNSDDDLINGRAYHLEIVNTSLDTYVQSGANFIFAFYNITEFDFSNYDFYIDEYTFDTVINDNVYFYTIVSSDLSCYFYVPSQESYIAIGFDDTLDSFDFTLKGDFVLVDYVYGFGNTECLSICENIPIEYVETHNVSAQDVFYNSVEKVQEMSIFSWAYDSFLVAPFQYILVLFGVPSNHVIIELLSYWLAVSIIWLVFDVIMYIPLLVHRWLDKGVLE